MATYGTPSAITAVVGLILTYCFMYNATIGATGFVALSEIGSTKLRNKTAGMAIALKNVWEVSPGYLHVLIIDYVVVCPSLPLQPQCGQSSS